MLGNSEVGQARGLRAEPITTMPHLLAGNLGARDHQDHRSARGDEDLGSIPKITCQHVTWCAYEWRLGVRTLERIVHLDRHASVRGTGRAASTRRATYDDTGNVRSVQQQERGIEGQ